MWKEGIAYYLATIAYTVGLFALYSLSTKIRQRSHGFVSFEAFLTNNHPLNSCLTASVNIFIYFAFLITQLISLKFVFASYLEPQFVTPAFVLTCLVIFLYVAIYGFVGVISTDKLQILGVYCLFAFFVYFIFDHAHLIDEPNTNRMLRNYLDDPRYGWVFFVGLVFLFPWSVICRQEYWQRIVSAENDYNAKSGLMISIVVFLIFATVMFFVTVILKSKYTQVEVNDSIPLNMMSNYESVFTLTVFVVGLVLCMVSTIDSYLNSILVSLMAVFNTTANREWNAKTLSYIHFIFALLLFTGTVFYVSVFSDLDLTFWFTNAAVSATVLLPSFIGALLNKYNTLAITLSTSSGLSIMLYFTYHGEMITGSFLVLGMTSTMFLFFWFINKLPKNSIKAQ